MANAPFLVVYESSARANPLGEIGYGGYAKANPLWKCVLQSIFLS